MYVLKEAKNEDGLFQRTFQNSCQRLSHLCFVASLLTTRLNLDFRIKLRLLVARHLVEHVAKQHEKFAWPCA